MEWTLGLHLSRLQCPFGKSIHCNTDRLKALHKQKYIYHVVREQTEENNSRYQWVNFIKRLLWGSPSKFQNHPARSGFSLINVSCVFFFSYSICIGVLCWLHVQPPISFCMFYLHWCSQTTVKSQKISGDISVHLCISLKKRNKASYQVYKYALGLFHKPPWTKYKIP